MPALRPRKRSSFEQFVRYLRKLKVSPKGHRHTARRPLRDKGVSFILGRSVYGYAAEHRHLPTYAEPPFKRLRAHRLKIEDAKPIFVFDEQAELSFLQAASDWSFPIFFTYAKTGLRIGELTFGFIEDLDLDRGWWHVRNPSAIGWLVKTRRQRAVPLAPEVVLLLRQVIGDRRVGPIFRRERLRDHQAVADSSAASMAREFAGRLKQLEIDGAVSAREQSASLATILRHRHVQHRTAGQTKQDHEPRDRKADPGLLSARLRMRFLIRAVVGHRYRRAGDNRDRMAGDAQPPDVTPACS